MTFTITPRGGILPHLPEPLLSGTQTTTDVERLIEPEYQRDGGMWDPGQEKLGPYFVPPFQRPPVWTTAQQVALVESALLGMSIGSLIVVDSMNLPMQGPERFAATDRWLLDGRQRMDALIAYRNDKFAVFAGTPCEHRWSDLGTVERRRVHHIQVGLLKIQSDDVDYVREVYDRHNFGGTAHTEDQRATPRKEAGGLRGH